VKYKGRKKEMKYGKWRKKERIKIRKEERN
jgi:hypothetical protein